MSTIKTGTTLTTAYQVEGDTTGALVIQTGASPTTAMTIDTSQNVGIGTSSPAQILEVSKSQNGETQIKAVNANTGSSARAALVLGNNTSSSACGLLLNGSATTSLGGANSFNVYQGLTAPITFFTDGSERARINSSGDFLVGTTSGIGSTKLVVKADSSIGVQGVAGSNTGQIAFYNPSGTTYWTIASNQTNWYIFDDDGSHYTYLSQNPTTWNFASDARIKTDITTLEYGLDTVMAIQPKRYKFIASGKVGIGFIAQELKEVIPEAVSGEELEFDEADTPQERAAKTLGVGKETLIPILVKAIQEQQAIIKAQAADIAALKEKVGI